MASLILYNESQHLPSAPLENRSAIQRPEEQKPPTEKCTITKVMRRAGIILVAAGMIGAIGVFGLPALPAILGLAVIIIMLVSFITPMGVPVGILLLFSIFVPFLRIILYHLPFSIGPKFFASIIYVSKVAAITGIVTGALTGGGLLLLGAGKGIEYFHNKKIKKISSPPIMAPAAIC